MKRKFFLWFIGTAALSFVLPRTDRVCLQQVKCALLKSLAKDGNFPYGLNKRKKHLEYPMDKQLLEEKTGNRAKFISWFQTHFHSMEDFSPITCRRDGFFT